MRNLTILFFLAVTFLGSMGAFASIEKPLLYEVRSITTGKTSYVLGTVHFNVAIDELPDWVLRLHRDAEINYYEKLDIDVSEVQLLQNFHADPARYAADIYVAKNTPEEIEKLVSLGIKREHANYFPLDYSCAGALRIYEYAQKRKWQSLDKELMLQTSAAGKKLYELDGPFVREVGDWLLGKENEPLSCDARELLSDGKTARTYLEVLPGFWSDLISKYREGDEDITHTEDDERDMILRNRVWSIVLEPVLKTKNAFIAVGAAHLNGNYGLLTLLEQKGFEIRRVTHVPR